MENINLTLEQQMEQRLLASCRDMALSSLDAGCTPHQALIGYITDEYHQLIQGNPSLARARRLCIGGGLDTAEAMRAFLQSL